MFNSPSEKKNLDNSIFCINKQFHINTSVAAWSFCRKVVFSLLCFRDRHNIHLHDDPDDFFDAEMIDHLIDRLWRK